MLYLAQSDTFLIKDIAKLLGYVMEGLFKFTDLFGIQNIGLSIILFTVVTKLLMMPLTIKQQKFSRMSSLMTPELQAIMDKYRGKTDNESYIKLREEQKAVYEKYGTSQSAGCLQLLIQMPIIFALYDVVRNIPFYVKSVGVHFDNIVNGGLLSNVSTIKEYVAANKNVSTAIKSLASAKNETGMIDVLNNQFSSSDWTKLEEIFASTNAELSVLIAENSQKIMEMNEFFGINLAEAPKIASIAVIIPILSGFLQWLSVKISQIRQEKKQPGKFKEPENNPMSTMNIIMPIMSAILALTLPAGLGVYWIAQSVMQILTQLVVNFYFDRQDINDVIAKNIEKANKKRAKQGLPPKKISANANINTSRVQPAVKKEVSKEEKAEQIKKSTDFYKDSSKGSIAQRAAMVQKYNDKHNKK